MAGLLDVMEEAERAQNRRQMSHAGPPRGVTGREMADVAQTMGLLASPVPVVGDVMGLLGDAAMYAAKPEERTMQNFGLTALGMLPFFPSALGFVKTPRMKRVFHGSPNGPIEGAPRLNRHDENGIPSFSVTRRWDLADRYADDFFDRHGGRPGDGTVTEFLLHGKTPDYLRFMKRMPQNPVPGRPGWTTMPTDEQILERAKKLGITAFDLRDSIALDELQVIDPSALVKLPNKSPLR